MSGTDLELIAGYCRHKSEEAFAEIVRRHVNLVYSAALRQVRSPQLAEEVAQSAFLELARQAHRLAPHTLLSAWLYTVTHRTALNVVRREARRQLREHIATELHSMNAPAAEWTDIQPMLDEAMHALDDTERAAVLLRYFENKSLREVGETLGASENAAQKRLARALERLREFFAKRGVNVSVSGLAVVLSAQAVQAAPAALGGTIIGAAALAGTTLVAGLTPATVMTMNWINTTSITAALVSALVAGSGAYFIQELRADRLQAANQHLLAQQMRLNDERDAALASAGAGQAELNALRSNNAELLRLRGDVGMLRKQTNDLAKLRQDNSRLLAMLAEAKAQSKVTNAEPRPESMQRSRLAKLLTLPLRMYASEHQGQFPPNFDLAVPFFAQAFEADPFLSEAAELLDARLQFEIVYHGPREGVPEAGSVILIREKQARQRPDGQWEKAYGFVDGSGSFRAEPDGNFAVWEKLHILTPKTDGQ
jgi:RNA polymerase sigma factor (sigma-70 family)